MRPDHATTLADDAAGEGGVHFDLKQIGGAAGGVVGRALAPRSMRPSPPVRTVEA